MVGTLISKYFDSPPLGPYDTAKNPVISANFLVWKFCGKAKFPHSFGRIARNYAETTPFHKISTPENQLKLQDFCSMTFGHTIKTKCVKLQGVDPEICSISSFQKRVQDQFFHHILCMVFQEKCFSWYILLTDQTYCLITFTP